MANIENLKQLRQLIVELEDHRLHMRSIFERAECGTALCVAGVIATSKYFREQTDLLKRWRERGADDLLAAAQDVLGLTSAQAEALFAGDINLNMPAHAVTKEEVLWNIDELLAGRAPRPYAIVGGYHANVLGPYAADKPEITPDDYDFDWSVDAPEPSYLLDDAIAEAVRANAPVVLPANDDDDA